MVSKLGGVALPTTVSPPAVRRFVVLCFWLAVGAGAVACSTAESEIESTIESEAGTGVEAEAETDGRLEAAIIVGTVELRPSAQTAGFSDLCVVEDRTFELDDEPMLAETTAFAVFNDDSTELARVPFLVSQLDGGSMVFGPVLGFADQPPASDSRDSITLPFHSGDLSIEIDGNVVSVPIEANELASLPSCTGTTASEG